MSIYSKPMIRTTGHRRVPKPAWRGMRQTPAYRAAVEALTNRERNAWARAGYPGSRSLDETRVMKFSRKWGGGR